MRVRSDLRGQITTRWYSNYPSRKIDEASITIFLREKLVGTMISGSVLQK